MIAVVQYQRRRGLLLGIDRYADDEGAKASARLSALEECNNDEDIEIVMLISHSEETMAATHSKYFSDYAMRDVRAQTANL